MNKKPEEIVAEKIIKNLIEKQLLPEEKKEKWIKKLSSEEIYPEDWNLLADFYIKDKQKNKNTEE